MTEETDQAAARTLGLRPVALSGRLAVGGLLLAGVAWVVRGVWEVRLAAAGEPASGPPDQGNGVHRPLDALENSYHFVTTLGGGAAFLCALLFVSWLWRLRDNARALSGQRPRYGGIWVYLGWIVPVVNLWVPRGLVVDAFQASAPGRRTPVSLDVWWGLWLVGMLSGVGLFYKDSTDEIIARAYSEVWPLLASDAAVVGAAVAGVFAVRAVTRAQTERMGAAGAAAGAAGEPAGVRPLP
ncbi:DUF4328 domain-containing protein [Streptomyces sp. NPDC048521]|uniref:DUF4328 domain-containing protein n=1 Tax=Streptomyces sp. NPDC048521 TaxID=3365566 RepID=UPI00371E3DA1